MQELTNDNYSDVKLHSIFHIEYENIALIAKRGARWLSGRMPDSQSSEPGFESPFATVSKIGHFRSLHCGP